MSDESAITLAAERNRDAGFFIRFACHVSCQYSQLLQGVDAEISEVIPAHLTNKRYVVSELCQAGGKDRRGTPKS